MILFYNVVYAYVCKIGEEKFVGDGGRFHGWVNPTRSSGIRTVSVSVTVPTNQRLVAWTKMGAFVVSVI